MSNRIRPARPVRPFVAIVAVSRPVRRDGETIGWEHVRFDEFEAFDVRDAWAQGEDGCELSADERERQELRAHLQGVSGPGGWAERPAWIDPACMESPEEEDARWAVHCRNERDAAAFA